MDKDLKDVMRRELYWLELIKSYGEKLRKKLSLPDLYLSDVTMWRLIVMDRMVPKMMELAYANKTQEWKDLYSKSYSAYILLCQTTPDPQRDPRDLIIFYTLRERSWIQAGFSYPRNRPVDHYTEAYGLDRPTAAMLKSLIEDQPFIEPEWIRI